MALTTQPAVIGGASKTLIVAADAQSNIAAAHVQVNSAGAEVGTQANPIYIAGGVSSGTQPISAISLPLPSGAAQDGTDATGVAAPTGGLGIRGWLSGIYSRLGSPLAVTGAFFQATQPVSGTVTANAGTGTMAVSAAALPLPAGAATAALQPVLNADGGALSHIQNFPTTQAVTLASLPALPAGTNTIGSVNVNGTQTVVETPFVPIPNATTGLTVGPTATTAPVALPAVTAATYRIRNAASSASPVAWRLATTNTGQAAVMPVANSTAGTGGAVGDKTIDPGGVEIFSLTAAQQTAIAAGSLYLSAITPAGGSATIYITPGVAGA